MVFAAIVQLPTRRGTPSLVQTKVIKFPNNSKNYSWSASKASAYGFLLQIV